MKIAVTAASGALGSAIVKQLKTDIGAENVIGVARTIDRAKHLGVEIRKGDYANRDDFNAALKGVEAVLIVSGMDAPDKRIEQHRNVIEAAKVNGVKKIVYTSIIGDKRETAFNPIINSNRQTENDVKNSGLNWVIGRNGLYIEPDLEYIDNYIKDSCIANSADNGKCAYTSRKELAYAYSQMLRDDEHNGSIYNLVGEPITQLQLTQYINQVYGTNLEYKSMSVNKYIEERKAALGEFLGTVIGGIYEGIRNGTFDVPSDFAQVAGRPHKKTLEIIEEFKRTS